MLLFLNLNQEFNLGFKNKIAVLRFSSLGDVAMTVPVIQEILIENTDTEILVFTKKNYEFLFKNIKNCTVFGVDFDNDYKGILGLQKLAKCIKNQNPTHIADLHNVLRTKILKSYFTFSNSKISTLDKGRNEKKKLISRENKELFPLKNMHERYFDVFRKLDFRSKKQEAKNEKLEDTNTPKIHNLKSKISTIGFAPFAMYKEKMLPLETSINLVKELSDLGYKIELFGGGKNEVEELQKWEKFHSNIKSWAGNISFEEELKKISQLDLMISMDSANMHLASIYGVRVISIWGATHPYLGFLGYNQNENDCVQIDLSCRPCSVFGNKECYRKDWACLNEISTKMIIEKIENK